MNVESELKFNGLYNFVIIFGFFLLKKKNLKTALNRVY